MHRVRVLSSSPAIGLALWCSIGMAPAAHAVVPCTVATPAGPVIKSVASLGACVERLQRATATPDDQGRIYGQYGPIRLAVTADHALRYYDDNQMWSMLQGHGGWAKRARSHKVSRPDLAQPAASAPKARPKAVVAPAPMPAVAPPRVTGPVAPKLSFAEALEAALAGPLPAPQSPPLQPVADTPQVLHRALVQHGFEQQGAGARGCGVRVARQWYRLATASLPECAARLAVVGRAAPRLRLVNAEWNGQELWLGPDAVYRKGPRDTWAVAAGF